MEVAVNIGLPNVMYSPEHIAGGGYGVVAGCILLYVKGCAYHAQLVDVEGADWFGDVQRDVAVFRQKV